jgi:hypothetical protein
MTFLDIDISGPMRKNDYNLEKSSDENSHCSNCVPDCNCTNGFLGCPCPDHDCTCPEFGLIVDCDSGECDLIIDIDKLLN